LAPGRCTSQQLTLQKQSAVRFWLQVETLHAQYTAPRAIGFLQALHRRQGVASGKRSSVAVRRIVASKGEPSMADEIRFVDEPAAGDLEQLEEQIDQFNFRTTGFYDGRALAAFLRDEAGALRAGLAGHTWGGCAEIKFLWVREAERRSGLGSRLLRAAESEALARGCARVVLSTHSFQAPDFYRRHGYAECGRAEGYPRGHAQIFLAKAL